jgi:hypothetical protein
MVLDVGIGTLPMYIGEGEAGPSWLSIPSDMVFTLTSSHIIVIVNTTYDSFTEKYSYTSYLVHQQ